MNESLRLKFCFKPKNDGDVFVASSFFYTFFRWCQSNAPLQTKLGLGETASVSRTFLSEIADFGSIYRQIRHVFGPKSREIRQVLAPFYSKFVHYPQNFKFYCIFMH